MQRLGLPHFGKKNRVTSFTNAPMIIGMRISKEETLSKTKDRHSSKV
jgi:hypothetical protein